MCQRCEKDNKSAVDLVNNLEQGEICLCVSVRVRLGACARSEVSKREIISEGNNPLFKAEGLVLNIPKESADLPKHSGSVWSC